MKANFDINDPIHLEERADALRAKDEGCAVEVFSADKWHAISTQIYWHATARYRRAPKPVKRPWNKPSDVPGPVCWIRLRYRASEQSSLEAIIVSVSDKGFEWNTNYARFCPFTAKDNIEALEHSTDRIQWKPCTTTEP
jgi:hypothetical protein